MSFIRNIAFVAIGVVIGLLGYGRAEAAYRLHESAFCMPRNSSAQYSRFKDEINSYGYVFNDLVASNNEAICPYHDDSLFSRTALNSLQIFVSDGSVSTSVQAQACIQWFGQFGGTCGTLSNTTPASFTGNATLTPGLSEWVAAPADWAYVYVYGGVGSRIFSYRAGAP